MCSKDVLNVFVEKSCHQCTYASHNGNEIGEDCLTLANDVYPTKCSGTCMVRSYGNIYSIYIYPGCS